MERDARDTLGTPAYFVRRAAESYVVNMLKGLAETFPNKPPPGGPPAWLLDIYIAVVENELHAAMLEAFDKAVHTPDFLKGCGEDLTNLSRPVPVPGNWTT